MRGKPHARTACLATAHGDIVRTRSAWGELSESRGNDVPGGGCQVGAVDWRWRCYTE